MLVKQKHWTRRPLEDLGECTDDNSTLFQAMPWCPLATNHYLVQCCPRSVLPHGITGPQWVNKYIVMSRMIIYTCLIFCTLGMHAYIILICTVKIQYDISYDHRNEETPFDQLSIYVIAVWIFLWKWTLSDKGIEFHVLAPWVFMLVRLISSLPCTACRSLACRVFWAWISELYT